MLQDVILARNLVRGRKVAEVLINFEYLFKKESLKRHLRLCGISSLLDHSERTLPCIILAPLFPSSLPSIRGHCPARILKCKTLNPSTVFILFWTN